MVLTLSLLSLLLLLPMSLALSRMGSSEVVIASNHLEHTKAFYTAESGVELAYHVLREEPDTLPTGVLDLNGGRATFAVTALGADVRLAVSDACIPADCSSSRAAKSTVRATFTRITNDDGSKGPWTFQPGSWRN